MVLPLSGGCHVEIEGLDFDLAGRSDVFAGVSDFAYALATRRSRSRLGTAGGSPSPAPALAAGYRLATNRRRRHQSNCAGPGMLASARELLHRAVGALW